MTAADLAINGNGPLRLWLRRNQQALGGMARFKNLLQTLRQARLVVEVGRQKGELSSVADLVDSFLDTPQMEACPKRFKACLLYTSPSPRDVEEARMPSSA